MALLRVEIKEENKLVSWYIEQQVPNNSEIGIQQHDGIAADNHNTCVNTST